MARIVVCGYLVRYPVIGMMLAYLHYILGLRRLGHEVFYLEESGWEKSCYNPSTGNYSNDPTIGLQAVALLFRKYRLEDVYRVYVNRFGQHVDDTNWTELEHRIRNADLVLNIGGVCWLDELMLAKRRAYVDLDPLFTQVGLFGHDQLCHYNVHFSYGTNIGYPDCLIPTLGYDWQPLLPPVVPEIWMPKLEQRHNAINQSPYTTIAHWQAYGGIEFKGERYGQKDEEFSKFISVAEKTSVNLEVATDNMPSDDYQRFSQAGWNITSAAQVSRSIESYRSYIQESAGEFSVAKNGYVKSNSGWFSDRSVCYLASGLPVIVQETGISNLIETGRGLLTFNNIEEACACLEFVNKDNKVHHKAALKIMKQYFDYRTVLPPMLEFALG